MKPLTANLKTLYQCSYIWSSHFILIIGILGMAIFYYKSGTDIPPIQIAWLLFIYLFIYGVGIASMAGDILSKPFGFCLPGHTKTVLNFIVLIWLSITAIFSFIIAVLYLKEFKADYALFFGSIGLMSFCYWVGVTVIIRKWIPIPFVMVIFMVLWMGVIFRFESMLMAHPWSMTFLSGILSYLIYRDVGRKDIARHLNAKPWVGLLIYNEAQVARFKREHMRTNQDQRLDRVTELAGSFFSERIRSNHNSMLLTHLWDQVYLMIGLLITYWRVILISGLCILIATCLLLVIPSPSESPQQTREGYLTFIILASAMGGGIFCYNRFDIFLLMGRREHFRRGVVFLFAVILIVLGYMSASVLLSNLVSGSLLPIMFESKSILPPNWWTLLVVPIIMIPFFGGLVILFREGGIIIPMVFMIFIAVVASLRVVNAMENTSFIIDLMIILFAAAITWGFHFAVLYYDSMKRSLC